MKNFQPVIQPLTADELQAIGVDINGRGHQVEIGVGLNGTVWINMGGICIMRINRPEEVSIKNDSMSTKIEDNGVIKKFSNSDIKHFELSVEQGKKRPVGPWEDKKI